MTITASTSTPRPLRTLRWRVVDIVVAAVLGVAVGLVFWGWDNLYEIPTTPLGALLPGMQALLYGVWLLGGVLGALVIRKPGAAVFVEVVAASVSALLGTRWGFLTLEAGLVQGLAVEIVFAILLYRVWTWWAAVLAGAAAGVAGGINDLILWYPGSDVTFSTIYIVSFAISGAVLAGVGGWLLTRALAATGALDRFASGRDRRELV